MKSKTHILMANLILEDLKKGKLNLNQIGSYAVPKEIRQAIINNPEYFRAGSIGPDFLPDMIVGQTVIHPENSGEWLEYLFQAVLDLSPQDTKREEIIAFYCGVMMHYAGDLYGHDYVNGWAKGWFPSINDILDPTNTENAKIVIRHILVEAYMDQKVSADEDLSIKVPALFIKECFTNPTGIARYPDDNSLNILDFMSRMSNSIHKISQKNTYASLNVFNYFNCWDKDIDKGILEWITTWNRIAADSMSEDSFLKMKADMEEWFSYYFLKMIGVPDFMVEAFHAVSEIIDNLAILNQIKEVLHNIVKNLIIRFVCVATGREYDDVETAIQEIKDMLKDPATFLNNGFLFEDTNITEQLDRDFGNFGESRDTNNQDFTAFYNCLNMCKLCLIGPDNLNALAQEKGGVAHYEHKRCISTIRNINITIKTSKDKWSGTDDNVYFGVLTKDKKKYEILLDRAGYNDFERGDVDCYRFELPFNIPKSNISAFCLRKDYIRISDDWKPEWIQITDANTDEQIQKVKINKVIKDREPYNINYTGATDDSTPNYIELDPSIISFMYSLDAKGLCSPGAQGYELKNPTPDKQWAHDAFTFYGDVNLRNNVMVPLFNLSVSQYSSTIFNDYTLAYSKSKLTSIIVYAGEVVDAIQLVYDSNYYTPIHGAIGGTKYTFTLDKDEYITNISEDLVDYLGNPAIGKLIITSNKKSNTYGVDENSTRRFTFSASDGEQIIALSGHCPINYDLRSRYPSDISVSLYRTIQ